MRSGPWTHRWKVLRNDGPRQEIGEGEEDGAAVGPGRRVLDCVVEVAVLCHRELMLTALDWISTRTKEKMGNAGARFVDSRQKGLDRELSRCVSPTFQTLPPRIRMRWS